MRIWVDVGYTGQDFMHFVIDTHRWIVEPVLRKDAIKAFVPIPQRWKSVRLAGLIGAGD